MDQKAILLEIRRCRRLLIASALFTVFLSVLASLFPSFLLLKGQIIIGILDYLSLAILIGCCLAVVYYRLSLSHSTMTSIAVVLLFTLGGSLIKTIFFGFFIQSFSGFVFGIIILANLVLFVIPLLGLTFYVSLLIRYEDTLRAFGYILNSMTGED